MRPLFVKADENKSGAIEFEDMKSTMSKMSMPMTDEEVRRLMAMFDKDHNGSIEYGEWNDRLKEVEWPEWESELAMSSERTLLYAKCADMPGAAKPIFANAPELSGDLDATSARLKALHPRHILKLVLESLESRFGTIGAAFRSLDTDATQSLSLGELKTAIHNLGE